MLFPRIPFFCKNRLYYYYISIILKFDTNSSIIDNKLYTILINLTIYFEVNLRNFSFHMPINSLYLLVFAIIPKNSLAPLSPTPQSPGPRQTLDRCSVTQPNCSLEGWYPYPNILLYNSRRNSTRLRENSIGVLKKDLSINSLLPKYQIQL